MRSRTGRADDRALSPVQRDDVLHDGEAETEATVASRRAALALAKALEDVRSELARDAFAGVDDRDLDLGVASRDAHLDLAAARRVADRVRQEVVDDLTQAIGVPRNG